MRRNFSEKIGKTGQQIDDWVATKADKHRFSKLQVWLGLVISVIAAVAVLQWLL